MPKSILYLQCFRLTGDNGRVFRAVAFRAIKYLYINESKATFTSKAKS